MTMMPPEMPRTTCVFCKATREILPRCTKCNKLLGLVLTSPYDLVCGRCKTRRTVGNPEKISV